MNDGHLTIEELLIARAADFYRLKDLTRTGWVLRGISDPESVADHSWGTALLALLFLPIAREHELSLDGERVLGLAVVHDIAEVETGDIPRRAVPGAVRISPGEKHDLEAAAIGRLTEIPPGMIDSVPDASRGLAEIAELWDEYEAGTTAEAQFVRDMNLIDMCLQAVLYEEGGRYDPDERAAEFPGFPRLEEFFETSRERFCTSLGKTLYHSLHQRYQQATKVHYNTNRCEQ
jgi:putative hydrolase of HD superfamily